MKPMKWMLLLGLAVSAVSAAAVALYKGRDKTGNRKKELHQQKWQAQLDEWKANLDRLKAKASSAGAEAQLELDEHLKTLESKIEEGKVRLAELAAAGEDTYEDIKEDMASSWDALASAAQDAAAKLKNKMSSGD